MFRSIRLALLALFALPFVASAAEPEGFAPQPIAVAGIKARRMDPEMISLVEDLWTRGFPTTFQVVRGEALGRNAEAARRCESSVCVAKKLKGAGPGLAVRAEVARLGGTLYLDVVLIDLEKGSVDKRVEKTCGAQEELLVKTLQEATFELLGAGDAPVIQPARRPVNGASPGTSMDRAALARATTKVPGTVEMKFTKIENPAKKKALYGTVGGALVATGGMLGFLLTSGSYDATLPTISIASMGLGLTAFTISGLVYVVTPSHIVKKTHVAVAPMIDGKSAGVMVAARF